MHEVGGTRHPLRWTPRALLCAIALAGGPAAARAAVYVVDNAEDTVTAIDPIRRVDTATVGVRSEPRDVAVAPDGSRVYVANGPVTILDVATNRTEEHESPVFATALAVPASGGTVLASGPCYFDLCGAGYRGGLAVLDATTGAVRRTVALPGEALAVAVRADGGEAYVSACGDADCRPDAGGRLHIVDLATDTTVAILLPAPAYGIALSPDGRRLFAPVFDSRNFQDLFMIDTATRSVVDTVRLPGYAAFALVVSPNGRRVYLPDRVTASVHVFDPVARRVVATIRLTPAAVFPDPFDIAIDPSGTRLWITDPNQRALLAVDVEAGTVVGKVGIGPRPFGVAVGPPVLGGDGSAGDDPDETRCARQVARAVTRAARRLVRCHARAARRALRGKAIDPDASTCRANAAAQVRDAVASLPGCEACASDLPVGLAQVTAAAFDESAASMIYCEGADVLYQAADGAGDGAVPPDRRTLRVEQAAGRALGKLAGHLVRCELAGAGVEACRERAVGRYDRAVKRLAAQVPCIERSADGVRRVVQPAVQSIGEHLRCVESEASAMPLRWRAGPPSTRPA